MNVFLIGYRGSGKTSVAAALAERLAWPWVDADVELERQAGKSIAQIFAESGEPTFRDWESRIVAELAQRDSQVIALGGGALLRPQNRAALAGRGTIVWLAAKPETLAARIAADPLTQERRPSLTRLGVLDEIRHLLAEREPIYAQCAHQVIRTDELAPAEIAGLIVLNLPR